MRFKNLIKKRCNKNGEKTTYHDNSWELGCRVHVNDTWIAPKILGPQSFASIRHTTTKGNRRSREGEEAIHGSLLAWINGREDATRKQHLVAPTYLTIRSRHQMHILADVTKFLSLHFMINKAKQSPSCALLSPLQRRLSQLKIRTRVSCLPCRTRPPIKHSISFQICS